MDDVKTEINLVTLLYTEVDTALKNLNSKKIELEALEKDYTDFNTLAQFVKGKDGWQENYGVKLNFKKQAIDTAKQQVEVLGNIYTSKLTEYQTSKDKILSDSQKEELKKIESANTKLIEAETNKSVQELNKTAQDLSAATFAQKNKQLFLYIGLFLLLLAIGGFFYFKFFKAKAGI